MGRQIEMFPRPPPSEDDRLNARLAAAESGRRARRAGQRSREIRCPACGQLIAVIP